MTNPDLTKTPFVKMQGAGNDFVVLDARQQPLDITPARARALASRHTGIGCDQIIVMETPKAAGADVFMRIFNADGSESGACGNATRCIADTVMGETGTDTVVVETISGRLETTHAPGGLITVDMGPARTDWADIPLAEEADTLHLDVASGALADGVGVNMGNPHAVFFVDDAEAVDLRTHGPALEHHPLFPERANIGAAEIRDRNTIRLRVWERGAGETLACGSGACAALVAANRRGLADKKADVIVNGGRLTIEWRDDGHVLMTGPVATSFVGTVNLDALS